MNFLDSLKASASGLSAQRLRMNLISSNLANINTTRTEQGGPYKRKDAVFAAQTQTDGFARTLAERLDPRLQEVEVAAIVEDNRPPIRKHGPPGCRRRRLRGPAQHQRGRGDDQHDLGLAQL